MAAEYIYSNTVLEYKFEALELYMSNCILLLYLYSTTYQRKQKLFTPLHLFDSCNYNFQSWLCLCIGRKKRMEFRKMGPQTSGMQGGDRLTCGTEEKWQEGETA